MNQAHTPNTFFNAKARRRKDAEIPIGGLLWAVFVFLVSGCDCCDDDETETAGAPVVDSGSDITTDLDLGVTDDPRPGDQDIIADLVLDDGNADQEVRSDVDSAELAEDMGPTPAEEWVCGQFIEDSVAFLMELIDVFTGLPYDQIPCGTNADGIERARLFGVFPQFHSDTISTFAHRSEVLDSTVIYTFVDVMPDGDQPSLIYALQIDFNLDMGNEFGGLIWNAGNGSDLSRYSRVLVRYRTGSPDDSFELKINAEGAAEQVAVLEGTTGSDWQVREIDLDVEFAATPRDRVNYFVIATNVARVGAGEDATIWIDQISFVADPDQRDACITCPAPGTAYADKACEEVLSGVANTANALAVFSLRRGVEPDAEEIVEGILDSLLSFAGPTGTAGWFQDWQSPTSLMPDARNQHAAITDQSQLFAAFLVVESAFDDVPTIVTKSEAARARMDWSVFYDSGDAGDSCPGTLYGAVDRCDGLFTEWRQNTFATEASLGAWLAVATGAAPACSWEGLTAVGCETTAYASAPDLVYYQSGNSCDSIPTAPFMQLVPLLYLTDDLLPVGPLTLERSAINMVLAQIAYGAAEDLICWGWSNASHPTECEYLTYGTCEDFDRCYITPHIAALALPYPEVSEAARDMLYALSLTEAGAPYDSGTVEHRFGLRDAWNQCSDTGRDAYLYLDTGWSVLAAIDYCTGSSARDLFAAHPVAVAGAAAFSEMADICSE